MTGSLSAPAYVVGPDNNNKCIIYWDTDALGQWQLEARTASDIYYGDNRLLTADDLGSGSGDILTDAPSDGKLYGRKDGAWTDTFVSGALVYKGVVADQGSLPADPATGDFYFVTADSAYFAYNGADWQEVGSNAQTDLDDYPKMFYSETNPGDQENGDFWFDPLGQRAYGLP